MKYLQIEELPPYFVARDKQQQFNANMKNKPPLFMHSWTQIFNFENLYQHFFLHHNKKKPDEMKPQSTGLAKGPLQS
jgi:hypothetical protein